MNESLNAAPVPRLVIFDLDSTLWYPGQHEAHPRQELAFHGDSEAVLHELATHEQFRGVKVAYASRTEYPEWAVPGLALMHVRDKISMQDMSHFHEIYPGNKVTHFRKLHQRSGIAFEDMLFFDNERRNIEDVAKLGVHCVYTPEGMTMVHWRKGLQHFAARR